MSVIKLDWKDVESSNISRIAYDDINEALYVKYKQGTEYRYLNVPKKIYEDLSNAESKGSYMNSQIKGKFEFQKGLKINN